MPQVRKFLNTKLEAEQIPVSLYFSPLRTVCSINKFLMQAIPVNPTPSQALQPHDQSWVLVIALFVCGELLIRARGMSNPLEVELGCLFWKFILPYAIVRDSIY